MTITCEKCGDTGLVFVPNSTDDFDKEFCDCEEGELKAALDPSGDIDGLDRDEYAL